MGIFLRSTSYCAPHLAGAVVIPLRIAQEKMLVFSESLPYTSLEIGQKRIFHLWP